MIKTVGHLNLHTYPARTYENDPCRLRPLSVVYRDKSYGVGLVRRSGGQPCGVAFVWGTRGVALYWFDGHGRRFA